ncbi:hypothetical protein Bca52824_020612 [Brassica carinata]|uniref:Uncharacterized protein n=1 Tax=Brassica carinata TaxID=52824 RepID=A0A8X7VVB3_BRACI|nr:hypothetical protein Bca52824_020612 [Brassica carinata]
MLQGGCKNDFLGLEFEPPGLLFLVVFKLRERAEPALKAIQVKRTMRNLDKRPSFKRMPSLSFVNVFKETSASQFTLFSRRP